MEIRYLEQGEKEKSRSLWRQCFPEDSERFLDYYYKEKCRDNQILVLEEAEDGGETIRAMVQRNPYQVCYGGEDQPLDYIVGVATDPQRRHRGYMRQLLLRMLEDQNREKMPFTFLMPADPAIYQPFGFVYVYDQPIWQLNEEGQKLRRVQMELEEMVQAAELPEPIEQWLNSWLEERYRIFARRDRSYLLRLLEEIISEYGTWELLYDGRRLVGMECFWGKEQRERRFLYAEERFTREVREAQPAIMARIVNLERFLRPIRLKPDCRGSEKSERHREITLGILDGQMASNQGLYTWRITEKGSAIRKISHVIPDDVWTVSIGELTQWLMGYRKPSELFEYGNGSAAAGFCDGPAGSREGILEEIMPAGRIFLDEVV